MNEEYKNIENYPEHLVFIVPQVTVKMHQTPTGAPAATITLTMGETSKFEFVQKTVDGETGWVENPGSRPGGTDKFYTDIHRAAVDKTEDAQFAALVQATEDEISDYYERVSGTLWRYDIHGTGRDAEDGLYIRVLDKAPLGGYDPEFSAHYVDKYNKRILIAQARTSFQDMVEVNENYIKTLEKNKVIIKSCNE